jgi:hypothetical protein
VKALLDRPIEGDWPYRGIDATYIKARQNGRIVSPAVIVAVSANPDGSARCWARLWPPWQPVGAIPRYEVPSSLPADDCILMTLKLAMMNGAKHI